MTRKLKDTHSNPKTTGPVRDRNNPYQLHVNAYSMLSVSNIKHIKYTNVVGAPHQWTYTTDPDGLDLHVLRELERNGDYVIVMEEHECMKRHPETGDPWRRYVWVQAIPYTGQNWKRLEEQVRIKLARLKDPILQKKLTQEELVHELIDL